MCPKAFFLSIEILKDVVVSRQMEATWNSTPCKSLRALPDLSLQVPVGVIYDVECHFTAWEEYESIR